MTTPSGHLALSVLDTAPVWQDGNPGESLRTAVDLARRVEDQGYLRYWIAEHHNTPSLATSSPSVIVGRLAAATSTLRLGSGGVMLPNHPPLVVAEQFATLAAFHPDRIDLGVGRAPGTDAVTAQALRRSSDPLSGTDFPEQFGQLRHYLSADAGERDGIVAVPAGGQSVPVFLLGSSPSSAALAGSLGVPFAFAHHLRPDSTEASVQAYRSAFRPSRELAEPYVIVAALVIAAETDDLAQHYSTSMKVAFVRGMAENAPFRPPSTAERVTLSQSDELLVQRQFGPQIIGGPKTLREGVESLVERTGADELMALTVIHDHEARVRSYQLLSEAAEKLDASGRNRTAQI